MSASACIGANPVAITVTVTFVGVVLAGEEGTIATAMTAATTSTAAVPIASLFT
jgi:hypothetical protein